MLFKNHFIYGPGKPLYALKQREVSSTNTAFLVCLNAILAFYLAIYYGSPCN